MIKKLCSYMFLNHDECKSEIHQQELNLINQIQELKAMNDFQAFELEQKINNLEEENRSLKERIVARKKKRADRLKTNREKKEK